MKGLDWILETQHQDGGWGQGEEAAHMGRGSENARDVSNVGDSCISLLALVRAGGLESGSHYASALRRGLAFVCGNVEASDEDSLHVEFTSWLLRFVDDVDAVIDPDAGVIHVRSASRVGYSDLGVNRKRVEAIRSAFASAA